MRLEGAKRYLPFQSNRTPYKDTYEPLRGEAGHEGEKAITYDYSTRKPRAVMAKWVVGFVIGIICGSAFTWLLFLSNMFITYEAGLISDAYFGHSKTLSKISLQHHLD
jgi:hypothetical protein